MQANDQQQHREDCRQGTQAYHLVHEAAAFYLEHKSVCVLQDIKAVDCLDGVGVWVALASKVCVVMLAHKHLSSLPAG